MRAKIVRTLMHKIGNAVYSAFVEEFLADGETAVQAHQNATRMTETAQVLIAESWLSLGVSSDWRNEMLEEPERLTTEERLRALLKLPPTNEG